jgi:hypothetical protein
MSSPVIRIKHSEAHDYELEPSDEIIAELQSDVVRSRQSGDRTRTQLLRELLAAVRAVTASSDHEHAVHVAALAIRLRMASSGQPARRA